MTPSADFSLGLLLCAVATQPVSALALDRLREHREEAALLVQQIAAAQSVPAAVNRVQSLGEEAYAAAALGRLVHAGLGLQQRRALATALALLRTPEAGPALASLLTDEDGSIRMSAAQGLGRISGGRHPELLLPLLADRTLGVRREAARALGLAHQPRFAARLLASARGEGEPEVKAALLIAVGQSGDRRQVPALSAFLESSSESARWAAARALCLLGAERGLAFASTAMHASSAAERCDGLLLLQGVSHRKAKALLRTALADSSPEVFALAARLLFEAGDRTMASWLVRASAAAQEKDRRLIEAEVENLHLPDADLAALRVSR